MSSLYVTLPHTQHNNHNAIIVDVATTLHLAAPAAISTCLSLQSSLAPMLSASDKQNYALPRHV